MQHCKMQPRIDQVIRICRKLRKMLEFLKNIYFYRLHFDSLHTNGVQLFISMVVHNVDSHHSCNHTYPQGNSVCLSLLSFLPPPPPSSPFFSTPSTVPPFFSCPSATPWIMYHHPLIREIIWSLVFWDCLISLSMIFCNFIHLPANAIIFGGGTLD